MNLNLKAVEILDKEFKMSKNKGYDAEEIDVFLDLIIQDYMKFEKMMIKMRDLEIENQNLKIKITAIKDMNKEQENQPVNINMDILKRLSRLELEVFGKNNEN